MTATQWAALSHTERELMICALEGTGMLAFVSDEDESGNPVDLPSTVLSLVDRGWVTVHRIESWTGPSGQRGLAYGTAIARDDLLEILDDPATWDAVNSFAWYGAITLWPTPTGWAICRTDGSVLPVPPPWEQPDWVVDDWLAG